MRTAEAYADLAESWLNHAPPDPGTVQMGLGYALLALAAALGVQPGTTKTGEEGS